jgi:RHS repeat-associated protein
MTIAKGGVSGTFVYGPEHQRARQDRGDGTSVVYADRQETELGAGGSVTLKTYWPLGIGVEIDRPGKATELRWTHTDRLGSPVALSDEAGLVQEELAYDPWGKRRDPVSHATPDTLDGKIDNKGFTNHEMLDQLDLVHMNGRVYDPFVARFLSGDPIIQDPTNGQNYDRYSYVFNNPTNFTDPTGFMCDGGIDSGQPCRGMSLSPQNFNDASTPAGKAWQREDAAKAAAQANASSSKAATSSGTRSGDVKNPGAGNSANREPTYSRVGFSSVSGQANDGSSVQVITDTWKRDSRTYGTPDQIMGQWLAFNPFEQVARDLGASQRQAFWIGVAGMMVGNPKQAVAQGAQKATAYSVFFETQIAKSGVGTRAAHFADANKSLQAAMAKDAHFAKMANNLGVKIPDRLGQSPAGWSWHHVPDSPGMMQLVPRQQHQGSV